MKRVMWLLSMLIWIVAGAASYLFVLNRLLIQLRGKRHKSFLVRAGGLLSVGFSAVLGALANRTHWRMLPAGIVVLAFLGEMRRLALRTKRRGAPPIAEEGPRVRLSKPRTTTDLVLRQYEVRVPNWCGPTVPRRARQRFPPEQPSSAELLPGRHAPRGGDAAGLLFYRRFRDLCRVHSAAL